MYNLLYTLGFIWGINFIFMKWGISYISASQIVWYRMFFACIPLAIYAVATKKLRLSHLKYWYHFVVMAVLANLIIFYFFAKATAVIPSGIAGAISGSIPLFAVIFSVLFLKDERLSSMKLLGIAIGFLGIVLITTPWRADIFSANIEGVAYMALGSFFYAFSFIYAKKFLITKNISSTALATYQTFFALLILSVGVEYSTILNVFESTKATLAVILGLGFFGTGIAYIIYYKIVDGLGAIRASTVTYIPPIVALIAGNIVGKEDFRIEHFIGVITILVGVYLTKSNKVFKNKSLLKDPA